MGQITTTTTTTNTTKIYFCLAWVRMCDFKLVLWANFLLHVSKGQTYGRSPVWMRTWVRRLKSSENLLPQPSNVHYNTARTTNTTTTNTTTATATRGREIEVQ